MEKEHLCDFKTVFSIMRKRYYLEILDILYHKGKSTKKLLFEDIKSGAQKSAGIIGMRVDELEKMGFVKEISSGIYTLTKEGKNLIKCMHIFREGILKAKKEG